MNVNGASDLARLKMLQRQAVTTRDGLDRAGVELSTGRKTDTFQATGGNPTRLFSLERSIERNAVFQQTVMLTELRLDVMQERLGRILKPAEDLAVDLSSSASRGDATSGRIHAAAARSAFADAVTVLNGAVAGQSLFAGTATDRAALADPGLILADLDALVGGAADAAEAVQAIEDYFRRDPAGAFFTNGYKGSTQDLSAAEVGEGQRVTYAVRADREEIVAVLQGQAIAAVVANGAFAGDPEQQMAMLSAAGAQLLEAKEGMLALRAEVGISQSRIETARAERVSERDTLDLARAKMVATDQYQVASEFQSLQAQLESIYTVTSRISGLRFSNFIR